MSDISTKPTSRKYLPEAGSVGARLDLVAHLAVRDVASTYRHTLLGWSWPVVRQVAQLAILVFVFSTALDLGIKDYPVFVFSGLIAWSWFAAAMQDAAWCLTTDRHLIFRAGFPTIVIPLVAIAVRFIDVLLAIPVLVLMLLISSDLHLSALFFPVLALIQLGMMVGLGWIVAAISVYVRDVPSLVTVLVLMLFYLTPVFFDISRVPEQYQWILRLNPMTRLLEGYREVLLNGTLPSAAIVLTLAGIAIISMAIGMFMFRRLAPGFVDAL